MILIIEFYQTLSFLSFNHIFLHTIGAFDVFLVSFSCWNDNLDYTTIFVTKLDDITTKYTNPKKLTQQQKLPIIKLKKLSSINLFYQKQTTDQRSKMPHTASSRIVSLIPNSGSVPKSNGKIFCHWIRDLRFELVYTKSTKLN